MFKVLDKLFYLVVICVLVCVVLVNTQLDKSYDSFVYVDTFQDTREMQISKDTVSSTINKATSSSSSTTSSVQSSKSSSTKDIIKMSDAEVWKLITEGKFSSYNDVNAYCKSNPTAAESLFRGLLTSVEIPIWEWNGGNKKSSKMHVSVNKYLAEYWKDFFTDLYNLPEKYCIVSSETGGYSFRTKTNSPNYSSHSFGATLDINWKMEGHIYGNLPFNTTKGLSAEVASKTCTVGSSWANLAKEYSLDWGGNWNTPDGMHFSLVGDQNKDTRTFTCKTGGRAP